MPSSVNEEFSSNDEPEAEAHCNQKTPSQSPETDQATNQEPEERTSSHLASQCEGNLATNLAHLRPQPARSSTPVIGAAQSLNQIEAEDITEVMTFSDAEEDQPNKKQNSRSANETPNNENDIPDVDSSPSTLACSAQSNEACALPQQSTSSGYHSITEDKDSHAESTSELNEDLDSGKVMEKLQQIQGYINQTTAAMKALEKDGNMSKPEQYKTLGKVMKDLEASKEKLVSRLVALEDKYNAEELSALGQEQGSSQRVGVVGSMNEVVNPLSMQERLARHETEQGVLSTRLRESVAKRQELVARYKNTRERLSSLKLQRQGLLQEEHGLLQDAGAAEDPYTESIPEALTWSVDQLKQSYVEFEELKNKVIHLHTLYETQARTVDEGDEEAQANIRRKKEQIDLKRLQVNGVLAQLKSLLEKKGAVPGTAAEPADEDAAADALSGAVAVGEALSASTVDVMASSDVAAKQEHLSKLKNQLNSMKRLLDETQNIRLANIADIERRQQFDEPLKTIELIQPPEEPREPEVLSFNEQFLRLSEDQKAHPEIYAKSQQIRQAKQRLAKMEDVMAMISVAREQGKPLHEVLTPEYMTILEDAQNELEDPSDKPDNSRNMPAEEPTPVAPSPPLQQPSAVQPPASSDPESDHEHTAMEIEPQKAASTLRPAQPKPVASANLTESDRTKHNRNIWHEATAPSGAHDLIIAGPASDPRAFELRNLQHELCRKQDTLEALMSSVGKSSSAFFADNSDNISVNISDGNSAEEPAQEPAASSSRRAYNLAAAPANCSKNDVQPTDRDLAMSLNVGLTTHEHPMTGEKNRNKLGPVQRGGSRSAAGFSLPPSATINNFSVPQGVRPKSHPYDVNKRTPNVTWEAPAVVAAKNPSSNETSPEDVQKMMSQLTGLQQTVNHLCDSIRQSKPAPPPPPPPMDDRMAYPVMPPAAYPPYHQMYPSYHGMPHVTMPSVYGGPYPYNYEQRNSDVNTTGHMMTALQQCLSQLHLNTMEIQALGKQLQMVVVKEKSSADIYPLARTDDPAVVDNPFRLSGTDSPSASFRFNECVSSVRAPSYSQQQPPPAPMSFQGGAINNLHDLDPGNPNYYPASALLDRSPPMRGAGSAYVAAMQPVQVQASKNILNNKVLPGTRANNYWDNFRSYSHQNPLSSTRKSNSRGGETFSGQMHPADVRNVSRTKEPIQAYPNLLRENRRQNVTSWDRNVNRAVEKNSFFGNKRGEAQARRNLCPSVPATHYSGATRRTKTENRREGSFMPPMSTEASSLMPTFPNSNLQARTFDEYRVARDVRQEDKGPPQESRSAVMRQAEVLLQRQHPQFLLKLFSYLSKITNNTDQHVALELLKELSHQDEDAINQNRWMSTTSSLNSEENLPTLVRNRPQINKNEASSLERAERNAFSTMTDADINEAFQCVGEDLQAKEPYDLVKNLAASAIVDRRCNGRDRTGAAEGHHQTNSSNNSMFYTPVDQADSSLWKRSKDFVNIFDTTLRAKDKSPVDASFRTGPDLPPLSEECKNVCHVLCPPSPRAGRKSATKKASTKSANGPSGSDSSGGLHVCSSDCLAPHEYHSDLEGEPIATFDGVVTAVFNKVVERIKSAENSFDISDRFLDELHICLMGIIEHNVVQKYPARFFTLIETKLRRALHSFKGRRICQIEKELPTAVSSVLIRQYSSYHYADETESSSAPPALRLASPPPTTTTTMDPIALANLHLPAPVNPIATAKKIATAHGHAVRRVRRDKPFPMIRLPSGFPRHLMMLNDDDEPPPDFNDWPALEEQLRRDQLAAAAAAAADSSSSSGDSTPVGGCSPVGDEPEGSFGLRPPTKPEGGGGGGGTRWNNATARGGGGSMRNGRESNLVNGLNSLPVHDLAEADQSREKRSPELEMPGLGEVTLMNGHHPYDIFNMAAGFATGYRPKKTPSQGGLDEFPTKLRSPPLQLPRGFDEDDEMPEPFEDLSFRACHSP